MTQPEWMRGYRSHGYWIGTLRIGFIGLEMRFAGRASNYGWYFEPPIGPNISGTVSTLREAKRLIEQEYAKHADAIHKRIELSKGCGKWE